jgi:hypothetical protein
MLGQHFVSSVALSLVTAGSPGRSDHACPTVGQCLRDADLQNTPLTPARAKALIKALEIALAENKSETTTASDRDENLRDTTGSHICGRHPTLHDLSLEQRILVACKDLLETAPGPYQDRLNEVKQHLAEVNRGLQPEDQTQPEPTPNEQDTLHKGLRLNKHKALLGAGAALSAGSIALIITGDQLGRSAYERIEDEANQAGQSGSICDPQRADRLDSCDQLLTPKALVLSGAIGLAAGLALTATAAALLHRAKRSDRALTLAPVGTARTIGALLLVRF